MAATDLEIREACSETEEADAAELMAAYLEWEKQDFEEAVEGIQRGYDDVKAGRTRAGSRAARSCGRSGSPASGSRR